MLLNDEEVHAYNIMRIEESPLILRLVEKNKKAADH